MSSVEDTKIGCFQVILLFLLSVNYVIVSMSHSLPAFHNYTPKFYCETSDRNRTYECVVNSTTKTQEASCPDYVFETDHGERSIVTDWGLICERSYLKDLNVLVYFLGVSVGAWIAGFLSDRIGRLPVLAICLYAEGTMSVATYIVQSYPVFLTLRSLQGLFAQGLQTSTYILTLELFPGEFRTLVSSIMGIAWSLGLVLLAILSHAISDWRILQLAVSVPTALTVLYVWIIPDSPRWLLAKGKTTEADIALESIAKYNACCCGCKTRREVTTNSQSIRQPHKGTHDAESANLLTPSTAPSTSRSSRRVSLRTETLEKRLSNSTSETFIQVTEIEAKTVEDPPEGGQDLSEVIKVPEDPEELKEIPEERPRTPENCEKPQIEETDDEPEEKNNRCGFFMHNRFLLKYGSVMATQWLSMAVMNSLVSKCLPMFVSNRQVNFAIGGVLELASYVAAFFILSRHGRRLPLGVCQTLNSVICMLTIGMEFLPRLTALPSGLIRLILLGWARVSGASTVAVLHLYTVEVFPTVSRGSCVGFCHFLAALGLISSPYLLRLEEFFPTSFAVAGALCLISAICCLILPDTRGSVLPESFEDVESLRNSSDTADGNTSDREILREKLFSEDWVDAGNGIIVNFSDSKN